MPIRRSFLILTDARPLKEGEGKGADRGVDGLLYYYETERKDFLNRVREDAPPIKKEPVHREKKFLRRFFITIRMKEEAPVCGVLRLRGTSMASCEM